MNHPIEYRGYKIIPEFIYCNLTGEISIDAVVQEIDGERCYLEHITTLSAIKRRIDMYLMDVAGPIKVETIQYLGGFRLRNITKFDWLSDAIRFAGKFNGELSMRFTNP